jgi:hypothetical protein
MTPVLKRKPVDIASVLKWTASVARSSFLFSFSFDLKSAPLGVLVTSDGLLLSYMPIYPTTLLVVIEFQVPSLLLSSYTRNVLEFPEARKINSVFSFSDGFEFETFSPRSFDFEKC